MEYQYISFCDPHGNLQYCCDSNIFLALQVIPIEGNFEVNDEPQKTFEEILSEIVISW